jgi:hypothetical protein
MAVEIIKAQLKTLRLPVAADELEAVLTKQKKAVSLGWLLSPRIHSMTSG